MEEKNFMCLEPLKVNDFKRVLDIDTLIDIVMDKVLIPKTEKEKRKLLINLKTLFDIYSKYEKQDKDFKFRIRTKIMEVEDILNL